MIRNPSVKNFDGETGGYSINDNPSVASVTATGPGQFGSLGVTGGATVGGALSAASAAVAGALSAGSVSAGGYTGGNVSGVNVTASGTVAASGAVSGATGAFPSGLTAGPTTVTGNTTTTSLNVQNGSWTSNGNDIFINAASGSNITMRNTTGSTNGQIVNTSTGWAVANTSGTTFATLDKTNSALTLTSASQNIPLNLIFSGAGASGACLISMTKTRGGTRTMNADELARMSFYAADYNGSAALAGLTVLRQNADSSSGNPQPPCQYEIWTSDSLGLSNTLTIAKSGITTGYNITSSAGTVNGATVKIGSQASAPLLKTKSWGTAAAGSTLTVGAANTVTSLAHGVVQANIVAVHAVIDGTSKSVQPNYPDSTYNFFVDWDATNININIPTGATNVASKTGRVVLWYY